ncbi:MAG: ion transporter permease [Candidatus Saccharibacteria bacterium]|nr:ion transporter permease [Candidatus Saccharibacteria bacterium]
MTTATLETTKYNLPKLFRTLANRIKWLLGVIITEYIVCAIIFSLIENRGMIRSFWWVIVTATTVGYGDVYPATTGGRCVGAFLMISNTLLMIFFSANVTAAVLENKHIFTNDEQERMKASNLRIEKALGTLPGDATELPPVDGVAIDAA